MPPSKLELFYYNVIKKYRIWESKQSRIQHNLGGVSALNKGAEGLVALALVADVAAESVGLVRPGVEAGLGIDVTDVDLHRRMVLGRDEAVGPRALAREVKVNVDALVVLHDGWLVGWCR
eukprot:TRINITY_DN29035_c0_g1_i1.p2 TRINITY_DN29035_c0_g1~~TRINITY_DN29035_c0_g1_i1.p2  ORF type:complete len:120 (-),score=6.19 TRINITY_DN29035_c0_g1_i1:12-371(-)